MASDYCPSVVFSLSLWSPTWVILKGRQRHMYIRCVAFVCSHRWKNVVTSICQRQARSRKQHGQICSTVRALLPPFAPRGISLPGHFFRRPSKRLYNPVDSLRSCPDDVPKCPAFGASQEPITDGGRGAFSLLLRGVPLRRSESVLSVRDTIFSAQGPRE